MATVFNPFTRKLDYISPAGTGITLPASGTIAGEFFYDTDDGILYIWDGTAWVAVGTAGPTDGYLTEDGSFLLTESGDYLVME